MNITSIKQIVVEQINQEEAKRTADLHRNKELMIEARAILKEIGITDIIETSQIRHDFGLLRAMLPDLDHYHAKYKSHHSKPHLEVIIFRPGEVTVRGIESQDFFKAEKTEGMKDAIIKHLIPYYKLNEEAKRK